MIWVFVPEQRIRKVRVSLVKCWVNIILMVIRAVYDAMARMAQPFSLRYPLVDGQGNFGSVDGDSPAAMRYTEARMARISDEMLVDINMDTVDFNDNYDGTQTRACLYYLHVYRICLLNGASGIAVGMATSIPPHNLA